MEVEDLIGEKVSQKEEEDSTYHPSKPNKDFTQNFKLKHFMTQLISTKEDR